MSSFEKQLKSISDMIDNFEKVLKEKQALYDQYPEETSIELSLLSLQAKIDSLYVQKQEILSNMSSVELDIRLHGEAVESGTASIVTVGKILIRLQGLISKLSLGLSVGSRGDVKGYIKELTQLRLVGVYSGSFGFKLKSGGQRMSKSEITPIEQSVSTLFRVVETLESGNVYELTETIAATSLKDFKKFVEVLIDNKLEFDLKWLSHTDESKMWRGTKEKLHKMRANLSVVEQWKHEKVTHVGYVVDVDTVRHKFSFKLDNPDGITFQGAYGWQLRSKVADSYDKIKVRCEFDRTIIRSDTEIEQIQWVMTNIEIVDKGKR